jgi:hypothetical protein
MAKKIIPLKLKKLKGSPLSFTRTPATDVYSKILDLQERALQRGLSQTLQQSKATGVQSAQAIANQLSESSAQAAAGIGEQERQNQAARVQQASQLQQAKAQSAQQLDMQKAQGQFQVDMQMRQGAEQALGRDLN